MRSGDCCTSPPTRSGLTLSYLASSAVRREDSELLGRIIPSLRRVCGLAQASFQTCGKVEGWTNDRTRWPNLLEGLATAIVLTLLMRYRETLLDVRQHEVLHNYRYLSARQSAAVEWVDLRRTLRVPTDASKANLKGISDPSPNGELVESLRSKILTPVMHDPAERPKKAGLILYGTPGTRKTTMVKELARALGWPMVTLSPPDFLGHGGLEGFEAAAESVFKDLARLRRVVVLFDECEDFFRPRPTDLKVGKQDPEPHSTATDKGSGGTRSAVRTQCPRSALSARLLQPACCLGCRTCATRAGTCSCWPPTLTSTSSTRRQFDRDASTSPSASTIRPSPPRCDTRKITVSASTRDNGPHSSRRSKRSTTRCPSAPSTWPPKVLLTKRFTPRSAPYKG